MDDYDRRISEFEDRVEELEKLIGALAVRLKRSEGGLESLTEQSDAVSHESAALSEQVGALNRRMAAAESSLSELSEDLDDTIEDFNVFSEEMRRRWRKILARQEQMRWDAPAPRYREDPPAENPDAEDSPRPGDWE